MATFLLVHGAFHGAWCFGKLTTELGRRGQRAVAIDLPGGGDDQTPIGEVSLDGNAAAIAKAVQRESEPVILFGHSLAGVSISAAAELVPERIALLVYLAAFLPRDGDSVASISASPSSRRESGPPAMTRSVDGLSFSAIPERARAIFYSQCSDEDVAFAVPRLRPQAYAVQRAALRLTPKRFGKVPRVYIECLQDNAVSLALQRDMVAKSPCREVISLATDHSPFFSAPGLLADVLTRLAGEADAS
jgi:pimeloyl-ACP methyl ester carboxylesterase